MLGATPPTSSSGRRSSRTRFEARAAGRHASRAASLGRFGLFLGDELVVDRPGDVDAAHTRPTQAEVELAEGGGRDLRVELVVPPPMEGMLALRRDIDLRCEPPLPADAFAAGCERRRRMRRGHRRGRHQRRLGDQGHDRTDMGLPGRQAELVRAVAAASPRTVVLVNAGGPATMDWADHVAAVVQSWLGGHATPKCPCRRASGRRGRVGAPPTTFPRALTTRQRSSYPDEFGPSALRGEPVHRRTAATTGAASSRASAFGHGLFYTTFAYGPAPSPMPMMRGRWRACASQHRGGAGLVGAPAPRCPDRRVRHPTAQGARRGFEGAPGVGGVRGRHVPPRLLCARVLGPGRAPLAGAARAMVGAQQLTSVRRQVLISAPLLSLAYVGAARCRRSSISARSGSARSLPAPGLAR